MRRLLRLCVGGAHSLGRLLLTEGLRVHLTGGWGFLFTWKDGGAGAGVALGKG